MWKNIRDFYPINDSEKLKETDYKSLSELDKKKWKNFISISKSSFIKKKLTKLQKNICPVCEKSLVDREIVIHHLDYKQLCKFPYSVSLSSEKILNKKISAPDCQNCPKTIDCTTKLVLIHQSCHISIHASEGRIKKKKNPEAEKKRELIKIKNENYWRKELTSEQKEIIQKSINIIREKYSNRDFYIKYNSNNISLKPRNILIFRLKNKRLIIRIKNGDKLKILEELNNLGVKSKIYYIKNEAYAIKFHLNKTEFNTHLNYFTRLIIDSVGVN